MNAKYDDIGKGYNNSRKADPLLLDLMLQHLDINPNKNYLDIGCGTGNYTVEIHKQAIHLIGVDPSSTMLEVARSKSQTIDWRTGDSNDTKLLSNSLDAVNASLTIHHWNDLESSFTELNRILKPDGKLVIFTSTSDQMEGYWLNHYFPEMMRDSMEQMPSLKSIEVAFKNAGFEEPSKEKYFVHDTLQDHFLYCGKNRPQLYFDDHIRSGISSFSSLAHAGEVQQGLKMLRADIDTGHVDDIIKSYENDMGDYLFLSAVKIIP